MGIIHLDDRGELLSVIVMNHFLQQLFPACVQPHWLVLPDLTGHTVLWELIVFYMEQYSFSVLILIKLMLIIFSPRITFVSEQSPTTAVLVKKKPLNLEGIVFCQASACWWRRFK